jgi:sulfoxide reductase heme-binding subunit YedZ
MTKTPRYTPLQIVMHLGALFPLARLLFDLAAGGLSPNPIQDFEQRTGRAAVTLLLLSLACTPLNTLFGWRELLLRRRALGLYAFLYAAIHVLVFIDLDYGLDWKLILEAVVQKRFILAGAIAFLLLLPLAVTSFDYWVKRLRRNWKRLHQVVYIVGPLVILHFAWARKGDIFRLQGDVLQPFIYGLILVLLLVLRIPPVRKAIASFRTRFLPRRPGQTSAR